MAHSNNTGKFLTGLIFGGLAGLAAAMLYAPQSGDETRQMIRNTALDASVRTRDTLRQAQAQVGVGLEGVQDRVSNLTQDVRSRAAHLKDIGNEVVQESKKNLEQGIEEAEDVMNA